MSVTIEQILETRVQMRPNGCWSWTGNIDAYGYGRYGKRDLKARRMVYEMLVGPIPTGLVLDHTCHNDSGCLGGNTCQHRRCVNPDHLDPTTRDENAARGLSPFPRNAAKTHCLRGHEFTPENTRCHNGKRHCRTCARLLLRKRRAAA